MKTNKTDMDEIVKQNSHECPHCKFLYETFLKYPDPYNGEREYYLMIDEIAGLKEKLHKHGKAIARIEQWQKVAVSSSKQTLKKVLNIFKEEGVK